VLFVTPEYNRSIPGVLKNAIDVGSRPSGHSAFLRKPGAVVSASPGALGGFGANHHLRQGAVFLDMPMLPQPEMYLNRAASLFDANGDLAAEDTKALFEKFLGAFAAWIARNAVA
jgi:chromate reductase